MLNCLIELPGGHNIDNEQSLTSHRLMHRSTLARQLSILSKTRLVSFELPLGSPEQYPLQWLSRNVPLGTYTSLTLSHSIMCTFISLNVLRSGPVTLSSTGVKNGW